MKPKLSRFAIPYVIWMALFVVAPIVLVVVYAFSNDLGGFTLENFSRMGTYAVVFGRSFKLALIATFICLLIGYPVSYAMSREGEKFQRAAVAPGSAVGGHNTVKGAFFASDTGQSQFDGHLDSPDLWGLLVSDRAEGVSAFCPCAWPVRSFFSWLRNVRFPRRPAGPEDRQARLPCRENRPGRPTLRGVWAGQGLLLPCRLP